MQSTVLTMDQIERLSATRPAAVLRDIAGRAVSREWAQETALLQRARVLDAMGVIEMPTETEV